MPKAKSKKAKRTKVVWQDCEEETGDEYLWKWQPSRLLGRKEYAAIAVHTYISLSRGYCADYLTAEDCNLIVIMLRAMGYVLKDPSERAVKRFMLNARKGKTAFFPPVLNAGRAREGKLVSSKTQPLDNSLEESPSVSKCYTT